MYDCETGCLYDGNEFEVISMKFCCDFNKSEKNEIKLKELKIKKMLEIHSNVRRRVPFKRPISTFGLSFKKITNSIRTSI